MENVSLKIYTATSGDNFIKGFWNINSFSWSSLENSITWLLKENRFPKNWSKSNSVKICFEIPSIRLSFTVLRQHPFISKLFPMWFIFITLFISVDTEICHHRQRPKKRYEKKKVYQHVLTRKRFHSYLVDIWKMGSFLLRMIDRTREIRTIHIFQYKTIKSLRFLVE